MDFSGDNNNNMFSGNKDSYQGNGGSSMPSMSMKWHNFLIYFALWASCVLYAYNGIMALTGGHYGNSGEAQLVYLVFSGLKTLDVIVGLLYIGIGVFALYTRFSLAGFKRVGPGNLLKLYAAGCVVSVVYAIAVQSITDISIFDSSNVSSIVIAVAMIFANKQYYAKRSHMFVN